MLNISWDYDHDKVTLAYDSTETTPDKLAAVIKGVGYETRITQATEAAADHAPALTLAPVPADAPAFFAEAMARAKASGRPVIIDFWAEWCPPCKRLKAVTMADPEVAKALKGVEVIFVDLDKHPELAKAYTVNSIPHVFFVNPEGSIVDRLKKFEGAQAFLERVKGLLGS